MPGSQIRFYAITEEEANKIKREKNLLNIVGASGIGLGILTYATESLVRNLGGVEYEGLAKQIFEVASYITAGGIITLFAPVFGIGHVISPKDFKKKGNLEEKAQPLKNLGE